MSAVDICCYIAQADLGKEWCAWSAVICASVSGRIAGGLLASSDAPRPFCGRLALVVGEVAGARVVCQVS